MSAAVRGLELYKNNVYLFLFFCMDFMAKYTERYRDKIKKKEK